MKKKLHSFSTNNLKSTIVFCLAVLFNVGLMNSQTDIAVNGGFETGDFTGWTQFISGTQSIITTDPSVGTYCAELNNNVLASASGIKNANVGIGTAVAGQEVTITLDARGTTAAGGVAFVKIISELSGGGTSGDQLFGPLALDPDPNVWKSFSFVSTLGSDVSGGVTLELTATTGGDPASLAHVFYDNIKITLTDVGPTARVQVIHNSPDDAAALVDVYLDGALLLDDFAFRTASPFVDAPAGTPISVAIAPSTSTSVADAIATFPFTLTDGETYVIVADGITGLSGTTYTPAPAFGLEVYATGREAAATAGNTDLLVHHGSTDAPTVDVNEVSGPSVLVDNISYGEFDASYLELPTADYNINISTADGLTVVESYDAPLATLGLDDAAAVVVASGFLDPAANGNGPAFGLWVALPTGGALVELPVTGTTAPTAPTVAAPTPTPLQSEVISLFSNAYTDVPVNTWLTGWSAAGGLTDIIVDGSDVKQYDNVDFLGIEFTGANAIDATAMNYFHVDVWSANATLFRVKLVDLGSSVEGEIAFNIAQGEWFGLDIPLVDFADPSKVTNPANLLTVRNSLQQLIFSGTPIGEFDFFVDNIYFSSVASLGTKNFEIAGLNVYPNPAQDSWTVKTQNIKMSSIEVFDMLGKNVMSLKPEATEVRIDASQLKSGLYFAKINTENGSSSLKLVRQ